jgi:hypothetical protein
MKYVAATISLTIVLRCVTVLIGAGFAQLSAGEESEAAPPAEQTQAGQPAEKSKLVCTKAPVMGSNIKKKTCKTQEQVDRQRAASSDSLNESGTGQDRANGSDG